MSTRILVHNVENFSNDLREIANFHNKLNTDNTAYACGIGSPSYMKYGDAGLLFLNFKI